MRGMVVDDRCNRIAANDIHTATHEHEALRRKIRHLRRFRQARCEPRLDRMTVGRRNVEWLSGQLTPDMTCNDLAGNIPVLTVALDRQHHGTREHRAEHRGCGQRLKRPASTSETSRMGRTSRLPRTFRVQCRVYAGLKTRRHLKLRKRTNRAAQRQQAVISGLQRYIVSQPPLELNRGSRIELTVAVGVHPQFVVIFYRCNHSLTFGLRVERSVVACPGTDWTSPCRLEHW